MVVYPFIRIKTIIVVCLLLFTLNVAGQIEYNKEIKEYAIRLNNSFNKLQKRASNLNFNDTSRLKWNNLPVGLRSRVGTSIGNMTDSQRLLVHRILSASLSSQGYLKATGIMQFGERKAMSMAKTF